MRQAVSNRPQCSHAHACSCVCWALAAALCCSTHSFMRLLMSEARCSCSIASGARLKGSVADDSKWRSMVDLTRKKPQEQEERHKHSMAPPLSSQGSMDQDRQ